METSEHGSKSKLTGKVTQLLEDEVAQILITSLM